MTNALDRRQFLKRTAASGAALAVWSEVAPLRASAGANDTLVVAMMGFNNRGTQLAPSFAGAAGVEVAYVCDVEDSCAGQGHGRDQQETIQDARGRDNVRRVLDDKAVDILVVAAPIIGTLRPQSWPAPLASTSTWKSPPRTMAARANGWSKPPGNTTPSCSSARSAAAVRTSSPPSAVCEPANSAACCWLAAGRPHTPPIGHGKPVAVQNARLRPLARSGDPAALRRQSRALQLALVLELRNR